MSSHFALALDDPTNVAILRIAEDQLQGFQREPFAVIAERSGVPEAEVIHRLRELLVSGVVRRIRQTLVTTNLAAGALVAWQLPAGEEDAVFDRLRDEDPFTGHLVLRRAEPGSPGEEYQLWTTVKVPPGHSLEAHVGLLGSAIGARDAVVMPARAVFRLGVGQMRRRGIAPGTRAAKPAEVQRPQVEVLEAEDWLVISILMREFRAAELGPDPWGGRIREAGLSRDYFFGRVERLEERGLMGRFATVLDHTGGARQSAAAGCTALLAWSVPAGCEVEAGRELGRHEILTHAYWREAGPRLGCLNLFGVAQGADRDQLLAHRAAIDAHLIEAGVPLKAVGTYWSERALVRPSALQPAEYESWYKRHSGRKARV